jgi:hypothetical protein
MVSRDQPVSSAVTISKMPPARTSQPQYESLRAYFIEGLASAQVARRFGYPAAAFRMLCYDFRRVNCQISCREAAGGTTATQEETRSGTFFVSCAGERRLKEQGTPLGATRRAENGIRDHHRLERLISIRGVRRLGRNGRGPLRYWARGEADDITGEVDNKSVMDASFIAATHQMIFCRSLCFQPAYYFNIFNNRVLKRIFFEIISWSLYDVRPIIL